MRHIHVQNETSTLKTVILGRADSNGPTPLPEEAYDPKSLEHILAGSYPLEADMCTEMSAFEKVLKKYQVEVLRPELLKDTNQIFTRDIGFVIDDFFITANILPDREDEIQAIQSIIQEINPKQTLRPPEEVHIEGGDVILWNDYIFIGTYEAAYQPYLTARTNKLGVAYIRSLFPHKKVFSYDLIKSKTNAKANALHLDCCFQPIGRDQAIIFPEGFSHPQEYKQLQDLFEEKNTFRITAEEMYHMNSNIFSISEQVIVTEQKFDRLNHWLQDQGYHIEPIPYAEIAKQEGLLRCSTLPLLRI